jgi:ribosomal protein L16 Arg81 hydroxylase
VNEPKPAEIQGLDRLLRPISLPDFFDRYWERAPLTVRHHAPDYFHSVLSFSEIDRIISTLDLRFPEVRLVNSSADIANNQYVLPGNKINRTRLCQLFEDGSTIILNGLQDWIPSLAALCRGLEQELSSPIQANVYVTPRHSMGFKTHFDTHDVFVLQIEGSKSWTLYDTPIELPLRGQEFDPASHLPGEISSEFDLRAGDVAYVPRGLMHSAKSPDDYSLHITVGVLAYTWADVLTEALAALSLREPKLRKAICPGFAKTSFDRSTLEKLCEDLGRHCMQHMDILSAIDHFSEEFALTRRPVSINQLSQTMNSRDVRFDTIVGVRPDLICKVQEDLETVQLICYNNNVTIPGFAKEAIHFILAHPKFTPAEIPGNLDGPGKITLVSRLIREGILYVVVGHEKPC